MHMHFPHCRFGHGYLEFRLLPVYRDLYGIGPIGHYLIIAVMRGLLPPTDGLHDHNGNIHNCALRLSFFHVPCSNFVICIERHSR